MITGAVGAVESSTMTNDDDDDTFPYTSVAVTESVLAVSWVRFTDIEKLPPVAVPVAVASPPVIVIVELTSAVPSMVSVSSFTVCGIVVMVGAAGGVESSTMTMTDDDDTLPAMSRAVTERVFAAFCARFTNTEKFPPVAVPVAVVRPPVIVIVAFASAVPSIAMESAFTVWLGVVTEGVGGGVVSISKFTVV